MSEMPRERNRAVGVLCGLGLNELDKPGLTRKTCVVYDIDLGVPVAEVGVVTSAESLDDGASRRKLHRKHRLSQFTHVGCFPSHYAQS
jgi:hypothetical protein